MQLTEHFFLREFGQPASYGLPAKPYPSEWVGHRLVPLCFVMEKIRDRIQEPIYIISGYRSQEWNEAHIAAGHRAAKDSQHLHGRAADIVIKGLAPEAILWHILDLHAKEDIIIGGLGTYPGFIHIDIRPGKLVRWQG